MMQKVFILITLLFCNPIIQAMDPILAREVKNLDGTVSSELVIAKKENLSSINPQLLYLAAYLVSGAILHATKTASCSEGELNFSCVLFKNLHIMWLAPVVLVLKLIGVK
jgi:hypothetical protein